MRLKLPVLLTNDELLHADLWGNGSIGPSILDLATSWSGQLHVPVALSPKGPPLPID
jgi:hypothetical protein